MDQNKSCDRAQLWQKHSIDQRKTKDFWRWTVRKIHNGSQLLTDSYQLRTGMSSFPENLASKLNPRRRQIWLLLRMTTWARRDHLVVIKTLPLEEMNCAG
ncbi:hypothetical protein quinque_010586 [Culex quinquefasciatus]